MLRSTLLASFVLLPLAGCGNGVPPAVAVDTTAGAGLNPGRGGAPSPAQVRLYQLRAPEKFANADYFQLSDHEADVLGGDLVSRDETTLRPGETRTVTLTTKPDTRFVGVAVAFRNIDAATWRAVTPVRDRLQLRLDADRVTLAPPSR